MPIPCLANITREGSHTALHFELYLIWFSDRIVSRSAYEKRMEGDIMPTNELIATPRLSLCPTSLPSSSHVRFAEQ